MEPDELIDERKAIVGLEYVETLPESKRVPIDRNRFPTQEISLSSNDRIDEIGGPKIGGIYAIHPEKGLIDIKKMEATAHIHPYAVQYVDEIRSGSLAHSLREFSKSRH